MDNIPKTAQDLREETSGDSKLYEPIWIFCPSCHEPLAKVDETGEHTLELHCDFDSDEHTWQVSVSITEHGHLQALSYEVVG